MKKQGFSIIELLIVIAIISILAGIAIPYYNDYIYDARLNTLKQNLATMRSTINQFRSDQGRGPFQVEVKKDGEQWHTAEPFSIADKGSELIKGAIQIIDGALQRRVNLKYLPNLPVFINPTNGSFIDSADWVRIPGNAVFYDANNNGVFDLETDFAFVAGRSINLSDPSTMLFDPTFDSVLYNYTGQPDSYFEDPGNQINPKILDYIDISIKVDGINL